MSDRCYASFKGARQGLIVGQTTNPHRKNKWTDIVAVNMNVEAAFDSSGGQATGKRQHSPVTITKQTGPSSPVLFEPLVPANAGWPGLMHPIPIPNQGGHKSGGGKHGPIVVTKEVDSASPLLFEASLRSESFLEVIIEQTTSGVSGIERVWRRVTLTNAEILFVRHRVGMETASHRVVSDFVFMCGVVRDEAVSG